MSNIPKSWDIYQPLFDGKNPHFQLAEVLGLSGAVDPGGSWAAACRAHQRADPGADPGGSSRRDGRWRGRGRNGAKDWDKIHR